jgi:predicted DNA-binding transcriptional regulator AlpA
MPTKKKAASPDGAYLDRLEIARMLKIRPETIADLVRQGRFPRPLRFNKRLQRWRRQTVLDHLARMEREGGAA